MKATSGCSVPCAAENAEYQRFPNPNEIFIRCAMACDDELEAL
jgi:hypothetical protein